MSDRASPTGQRSVGLPAALLRDRPLAAYTGLVVAGCLFLLRQIANRPAGGALAEISIYFGGMLAIDAGTAVAALQVVRRLPDRGSRRSWAGAALAGLIYLAGDLVRIGHLLRYGDPARTLATGVEGPFMLGAAVALLGGILLYPVGATTRRGRLRFWLDAGVVLVGASAVSMCLLLEPGPGAGGADRLTRAFGTAALMATLVFAALKLLLNERPPLTRTVALFAVASGVLLGVIDWLPPVTAGDQPRRLGFAATMLSSYLLVAAFRVQVVQLKLDPGVLGRRPRRPFSVLPYLTMAVMFAVAVVILPGPLDLRARGALTGLAVISLMVIMRQLVEFRDNADLVRRLDGNLAALRAHEERLQALLRHSSDITLTVSADGRVTYVSPAVLRLLGVPPEAVSGRHWWGRLHPDDRATLRSALPSLLADDGAVVTWQVRARHADGRWRWLETICTNLLADPVVGGVVCNAREVTETRELHDRLRHEASHDPLTGLANRAYFGERLAAAMVRPPGGSPVSVLLIDLDEFKGINDRYGHHAGDAVLVAVAERLRDCVREGDVAARLGGDEFAAVLPGADAGQAARIAERFRERLRLPVPVDGRRIPVRASIGIATGSGGAGGLDGAGGADGAALLRAADADMYLRKGAARAVARHAG